MSESQRRPIHTHTQKTKKESEKKRNLPTVVRKTIRHFQRTKCNGLFSFSIFLPWENISFFLSFFFLVSIHLSISLSSKKHAFNFQRTPRQGLKRAMRTESVNQNPFHRLPQQRASGDGKKRNDEHDGHRNRLPKRKLQAESPKKK
jgi:hypothetical protein